MKINKEHFELINFINGSQNYCRFDKDLSALWNRGLSKYTLFSLNRLLLDKTLTSGATLTQNIRTWFADSFDLKVKILTLP